MNNLDILKKFSELVHDPSVTMDEIRASGFERVYIKPLAKAIATKLNIDSKQHINIEGTIYIIFKLGGEWTISLPYGKNNVKEDSQSIELPDIKDIISGLSV